MPSWLKLAQWLWRRRFLKFVNVFSPFHNYLPLKIGGAFHLNKLESPSLKDALCQVWLKLAHWFWRRRWKCEKFTDRQTDGRTTDKKWSESLTWAFSSGDLKTQGSHLSFDLIDDCFWKIVKNHFYYRWIWGNHSYLVFHHSLHWNEWQFCDDVTVDFAFDNLLVLKNLVEMNLIFFRLIEVWTKKGRKTASMRVAHCCRSFPFFFRLIPRSTEKNIRFISYQLIFISFQQRNRSFLLINGFFLTFDVVELYVTSQYSWCRNHLNFLKPILYKHASVTPSL